MGNILREFFPKRETRNLIRLMLRLADKGTLPVVLLQVVGLARLDRGNAALAGLGQDLGSGEIKVAAGRSADVTLFVIFSSLLLALIVAANTAGTRQFTAFISCGDRRPKPPVASRLLTGLRRVGFQVRPLKGGRDRSVIVVKF